MWERCEQKKDEAVDIENERERGLENERRVPKPKQRLGQDSWEVALCCKKIDVCGQKNP